MKKTFEYDLTKYDPNAPTRTEQFLTADGVKTLITDANDGAVLIQDSVDGDSLNPVTAAAVATAIEQGGGGGGVPDVEYPLYVNPDDEVALRFGSGLFLEEGAATEDDTLAVALSGTGGLYYDDMEENALAVQLDPAGGIEVGIDDGEQVGLRVKVDGTTIQVNADNELEAIGGGGGGSIPHINAQGTLSSGEIQVNVGTSLTSGCWLGFITTEENRGIPVANMPFTENDLILVSAHSEDYDVNIGAVFHPYVWTSGSTAGYYVQCMFNAWVSDPTDRTWKFTFKKQDGTDITTALANNEIWFNLYKMS